MLGLVFIILIIYTVIKSSSKNSGILISNNLIMNKLNKALENNQFTNKKTLVVNSYYKIIKADTHGENYVFAVTNDNARFNELDIKSIYEVAQKLHIHNIVIINQFKTQYPNNVLKIIEECEMEIWDLDKLNTLAGISNTNDSPKAENTSIRNELSRQTPTITKSVLRTSNTSNDKCDINTDLDDPIQDFSETHTSILKRLFRKPDRL